MRGFRGIHHHDHVSPAPVTVMVGDHPAFSPVDVTIHSRLSAVYLIIFPRFLFRHAMCTRTSDPIVCCLPSMPPLSVGGGTACADQE